MAPLRPRKAARNSSSAVLQASSTSEARSDSISLEIRIITKSVGANSTEPAICAVKSGTSIVVSVYPEPSKHAEIVMASVGTNKTENHPTGGALRMRPD